LAGGSGYIGLAHALLQTGARSVLVSLWGIDDRAASLLMRRFYGDWTGRAEASSPMSKAGALREAKRWLRDFTDERGNRPYAHPYYWSAFVLIGDPD
jgi:CHAT domain-containing protein